MNTNKIANSAITHKEFQSDKLASCTYGMSENKIKACVTEEFTNDERSTFYIKCAIKDFKANVLLDSGAGCSVISVDILHKLTMTEKDICRADKILLDASGNNMNIVGKIVLPVQVIGLREQKETEFYVVDANYSCLLLGADYLINRMD